MMMFIVPPRCGVCAIAGAASNARAARAARTRNRVITPSGTSSTRQRRLYTARNAICNNPRRRTAREFQYGTTYRGGTALARGELVLAGADGAGGFPGQGMAARARDADHVCRYADGARRRC